jgi:hypothetical protein
LKISTDGHYSDLVLSDKTDTNGYIKLDYFLKLLPVLTCLCVPCLVSVSILYRYLLPIFVKSVIDKDKCEILTLGSCSNSSLFVETLCFGFCCELSKLL